MTVKVRVVFAQRKVRLVDGGGIETFRSLPFGHPILEVRIASHCITLHRMKLYHVHDI